jgi:hypothetical protein
VQLNDGLEAELLTLGRDSGGTVTASVKVTNKGPDRFRQMAQCGKATHLPGRISDLEAVFSVFDVLAPVSCSEEYYSV